MSAAAHDRGLKAVRRVREARERDSRIGLVQALAATRQREAEAEAARDRFESTPPFEVGTSSEFRIYNQLVQALAEAVAVKEELLRTSRTVAEEANRRWGLDRQAVRTVELLLERRVEERRAARARQEAADLDELASQAWHRNHLTVVPAVSEASA